MSFFALPGTYYVGFMSLFVVSKLIVVIYYSLDRDVFYRAIMALILVTPSKSKRQ